MEKNCFKEMDNVVREFLNYLDIILENDDEINVNSVQELIDEYKGK